MISSTSRTRAGLVITADVFAFVVNGSHGGGFVVCGVEGIPGGVKEMRGGRRDGCSG